MIGDVESVQQQRITLSLTVFFFSVPMSYIHALLSVSSGDIGQDRAVDTLRRQGEKRRTGA